MKITPEITGLLASEAAEAKTGSPWGIFYFVGLVVVTMVIIMSLGGAGMKARVFRNPITACLEQLYLFLTTFATGIIGPHGKKYLPMLATFWLFIFISNIYGLFLDETPTADWSLNLGLAVIAVFYVQYEGIRTNGIFGHVKHFSGPKLTGALILVSGMIFMIEIVSEAMKLLSLSLRLYGNIHGGHEVVTKLNALTHFHIGSVDVAFPIGGILLPIKLLTCIVQALVFTLLFSVYLGLATHHEEGHAEEHGAGAEAHAAA